MKEEYMHPVKFTQKQIRFIQYMINNKGLEYWEEGCKDILSTIEQSETFFRDGYMLYLTGCVARKEWLKEAKSTLLKRALFYIGSRNQQYNINWITHLVAMEKLLKLKEGEKRIFNVLTKKEKEMLNK